MARGSGLYSAFAPLALVPLAAGLYTPDRTRTRRMGVAFAATEETRATYDAGGDNETCS